MIQFLFYYYFLLFWGPAVRSSVVFYFEHSFSTYEDWVAHMTAPLQSAFPVVAWCHHHDSAFPTVAWYYHHDSAFPTVTWCYHHDSLRVNVSASLRICKRLEGLLPQHSPDIGRRIQHPCQTTFEGTQCA